MGNIASRFFGDSEHFTFAHRVFNFTLLMGILMTFTGAVVDWIVLGRGIYWLPIEFVWVFLYYLSRFKGYFKPVSIISFSILIYIVFPFTWITGKGSYGPFPYYALVFIAITGIVLSGWSRYILISSLMLIVIALMGLEVYLPGIIGGYGKGVDRYLDISINLFLCIFFMAVLIIIYSNVYNNEKKKEECHSRTIAEHYQYHLYYMKNLEQLIYRLKAKENDFNQHLGFIYTLLEGEETTAVSNYTEKLLKDTEEYQNIVRIPYSVLGAMLNYKLSTVRKENIPLKLKINIPGGLKLNEFELTIIIGYLLDNALEACLEIDEKGRYIKLVIHYKPDYLVIRIENPLLEKQTVKKQLRLDAKYQTGKKDTENHGFGLNNIEYLVNKHNGIMKKVEEENVFKVDIALLMDRH